MDDEILALAMAKAFGWTAGTMAHALVLIHRANENSTLSPTTKDLYTSLVFETLVAKSQDRLTLLSAKGRAEAMKVSPRTINQAVKDLEREGFLDTSTTGKSPLYTRTWARVLGLSEIPAPATEGEDGRGPRDS